MEGTATWRGRAKTTRDRVLWRTPGLQTLVRGAARRRCVPRAFWRRLHPSGLWVLHAPDGTPFAYDSAYPHDGLARHIVWTDMRDWEATTQPVLFDLARQAEVFVDVGAYSGIYTVLACVANPRLRAVAVEPNPSKLPQLRSNVTANGITDRVTIIGKALSARAGTARLAIPGDDSTASLRGRRAGDRAVDVDVTTGDVVLDGLRVGLVKIDVEGFESDVVKGMARVLRTHHPKIIAECLDPEALDELRDSTRELGYRHVYHLGSDGPVTAADRPFSPANYLFTIEPMTNRMLRHG
ncbi:FkbM family methyltransferase [Actinomadura sp. DC4]|uniref:FkbM family methyltransferase n=1 Tax=Actinomadura sp. DC4 TaxID=3055069 RepID=UPI0025AFF1EC|nr:FkbM family methyltransferase [Actinomadura sp. DC4]MDN3358953.1 FkbM family methyltransferase [Actinomadura sp. DC4]